MKIGCAAWSLTPSYDAPVEEAIDTVARLGFQGIELIGATREMLYDYYTPSRCADLLRQIRSHGLEVSGFTVYAHAIEGLASLDFNERERALADFEQGARIAKALGAPVIITVSHWIPGLKAPVLYPPALVYISVPGLVKFEPKLKFTYPDFDWDQIWENYRENMRLCADIAAAHGLRFALEGHPHVIVSHTDSFLRLFDQVPHPALGMNFDTGMQAHQREYIPWSIEKLKQKIFHMHVRDSDSLISHQLPIGQGVLDWKEILTTLQRVRYEWYLSIELTKYQDPVPYLLQSRLYLERILAELKG